MKKIILTIFCLGMLFPLLGSAARPYGVEEIPNVQIGDRYRFTSIPTGFFLLRQSPRSIRFAIRSGIGRWPRSLW